MSARAVLAEASRASPASTTTSERSNGNRRNDIARNSLKTPENSHAVQRRNEPERPVRGESRKEITVGVERERSQMSVRVVESGDSLRLAERRECGGSGDDRGTTRQHQYPRARRPEELELGYSAGCGIRCT